MEFITIMRPIQIQTNDSKRERIKKSESELKFHLKFGFRMRATSFHFYVLPL
jgi:hypothetical protein